MIKRCLPALLLVCVAGLVSIRAARAQDLVFAKDHKDKGIKGKVEAESTRGVKLSSAKALIPAEDIIDITYEVLPLEIRLNAYRPAVEADRQVVMGLKAATRKGAFETAVKKYQQALAGMTAGQTFAARNIEFRMAYLQAFRAGEDPKDSVARDTAIEALKAFKTKHPSGWQIGRALKALAELEVEQKDYTEAERTYRELAAAKVDEATREQAELLAATVPMRAQRYADAVKNLQALIAKLPPGSRQSQQAQVALGEALTAAKKPGEAKATLTKVVAETKDRDLKAMAYNALGYCSFVAEQYQEARWDFLWVDVVYNRDKAEHAKALYYLWQTFERLNEPDRARNCLETLLGDPQFSGTEFQRRAQQERAKGQ
jgi:tetratricopeptide (TPR) repeat protein